MEKRDIFYTAHDGLKLYAAEYGPHDSDITVLCMHGLTRNHKDFEPMIRGLELPARYISVDVRGRGRSDRDPSGETYAPPVYVQDMATLIDHLKLDNLILVGTSIWTMPLQQLAEHRRASTRTITQTTGSNLPSELARYAMMERLYSTMIR